MPRIVHGLFIAGLSHDGADTDPVLFTDGPLNASSISGLSPLGSSTNVVQHLVTASISGAAARISDLRDPLIAASAPSVQIADDRIGTYSRYFAPDPGWANTTRWILVNATTLPASTTSMVLSGDTAPTVNQLVYLGNETIRIDSVSQLSFRHIYTCGVTRGVCGSRAVTHSLDPSTYPPGDDGSRESLVVYSRRVYDGNRKIEAALYMFSMSETNPENIESAFWVWYGYLSDVPKQNADFQWTINVKHFTQALTEFQMRGGEPLDLARCVQSTQLSTGYYGGTGSVGGVATIPGTGTFGGLPQQVIFHLTVYEFERLFNVVARAHHASNFTGASALGVIEGLLTPDGRVFFELTGEVGGHSWVWRVTGIDAANGANNDVISVYGTLTGFSPKASATDDPVTFEPDEDFTYNRDEGLNAGFTYSNNENETRVRLAQGETAPKISCRLRLSPCTFVDAALMILLSGYGSGVNDATYDLIPGGRGMQFNPSWLNTGSAPADPLAVSKGTQLWLEHLAIDDEVYEYAFTHETKIGDWFRNELLLRNMILAFVPTTGKIGPRIWVRNDSYTALRPVIFPETDIDSTENLPEQRAVFLERGIDSVTLEAKFRKPLQDLDARSSDLSKAPTVRIWKQGGSFSDEELQAGNLSLFLRAVFGVGVGTPRVFPIPLSVDDTVSFGDLVTWTDPFVATASGRGFTTRKLICLGIDPVAKEAIKYAYCVEDLVNLDTSEDATTKLGTALRIDGIVDLNTTARTATLLVSAFDIGQVFRIDTGDSSLWSNIVTGTGVVSIRTEALHNPRQTAGERLGYQEMYVTITAVTYDAKAKKSYISVSWSSAMGGTFNSRGVTAENVIAIGSIVQLPDYRAQSAAPTGTAINPVLHQGYNAGAGSNRTHISALSRRPRFDGRRSLLGS